MPSGLASHPILIFLDADVRLKPGAVVRMTAFLEQSGAALASGVPEQVTRTASERLLVPLIHFVLLGFLPIRQMRIDLHPALGAGCGQLFVAFRHAYVASGGHRAIRRTLHDGPKLPRVFRSAGFRTDLFDATDLASCRMFSAGAEVWRGLARNAGEGLGSPRLIGIATLLLVGGQVLPIVSLAAACLNGSAFTLALSLAELVPPICHVCSVSFDFDSPSTGRCFIRLQFVRSWQSSGLPFSARWRGDLLSGRVGSIFKRPRGENFVYSFRSGGPRPRGGIAAQAIERFRAE